MLYLFQKGGQQQIIPRVPIKINNKEEYKMLNQTVIVGRIVRDPELKNTDHGKKVTNLTLAVPCSYNNMNGDYDQDFIPCV